MLQMTPRAKIPAHRFPPVPFLHRRHKISPADRRVIRLALRGGASELPTDWPDLQALLALLDDADRPLPEGIRRRADEGAA